MSTTIFKLKKSSVASRVPGTSDLAYGELAINYEDGVIYYKNSSNLIQKIASNSYLQFPHSTTITYTVVVASKDATHRYNGTGSGSGYKIDGVFSPFLTLVPGRTYRFDQSDSTNGGHPLLFYYDAAKTASYTTGVTTNGTPGSAGAYTEITISDSTPSVLHYQCSAHGYMGNAVQTNSRNLTGFDTDDLTEGSTNLYYTDTRARASVSLGTAGSQAYNSSTGVFTIPGTTDHITEGSNLYYTDARVSTLVDSAYVQARQVDLQRDSAFITGVVDSDYIKTVNYLDNEKLIFGNNTDLQIYSNGTNSFITEGGTGDLVLQGGNIRFENGSGEYYIRLYNNSKVALYHDNSVKLETSATGITVTGTVNADSATFTNLTLNNELVDSSWVQARQITYDFLDSSEAINLIDSAYVQARQITYDFLDSGEVINLIDSAYVQARQSITGGTDPIFKTISVSGQSDVVADLVADTLTLVAGTGMTITTNAATDTITFTSAAAGVDSAATIALIQANSVDSAKVINLIDSAYVQARQSSTSSVNTFSTISIAGQSDVIADSTSDTLTLVAGSGITLSTTAASDEITITSTAGAGGGGLVTGTTLTASNNLYTGDSSTTTFTLSTEPSDENNVIISINGVVQQADTYSLTGSVITLDSAPVTGDEIEMRVFNHFSANVSLRDYQNYVYQPSSSTTAFSGTDINGNSLTYDVGKLEVYVNGARLVNGLDYTATSGTSVVLINAIDNGDTLEIVSLAAATLVNPGIAIVDSDLSTTTTDQIVDTFSKTQYRTVKYVAQIEHDSSSSYHAEEILLTHNGSTVAMTTYAQILLDSSLGTFDADVVGDLIRLKFSPTKTNTSTKLRKIQVIA